MQRKSFGNCRRPLCYSSCGQKTKTIVLTAVLVQSQRYTGQHVLGTGSNTESGCGTVTYTCLFWFCVAVFFSSLCFSTLPLSFTCLGPAPVIHWFITKSFRIPSSLPKFKRDPGPSPHSFLCLID